MTTSMRKALEAFKSEYQRWLREHPEDVLEVDALDELIHQVRVELGAFTMEATVQEAVHLGLAHERVCPCGGTLEIHRRPKLQVHSMQGDYEAQGVALRCPDCGLTKRPAHDLLGIESYSRTTQRFDRLAADFFLDKGAVSAVQRFQEHHGIEPGRTTVLRHVEARGQQAREFVDHKLAQATAEAETKRGQEPKVEAVFAQMDASSGKTVAPLSRPDVPADADVERTPVRGLPKVKRPIEGRQVKLLCTQPQGAADWVYDAYIGEYDEAPAKLVGLAAACGWQDGVHVVMTADGDDKIRECAEGAFQPNLQMVLDQQHALSHLHDVVTYGKEAVPEAPGTDWVSAALQQLCCGQVRNVVAEVQAMVPAVSDPKNRQKVENVATYFHNRADSVHYDELKAHGWPIASGAVEGGHIHIMHPITKRGSGWLVPNLNGVIALACVRHSGWWDEFWQWVRSEAEPCPAASPAPSEAEAGTAAA